MRKTWQLWRGETNHENEAHSSSHHPCMGGLGGCEGGSGKTLRKSLCRAIRTLSRRISGMRENSLTRPTTGIHARNAPMVLTVWSEISEENTWISELLIGSTAVPPASAPWRVRRRVIAGDSPSQVLRIPLIHGWGAAWRVHRAPIVESPRITRAMRAGCVMGVAVCFSQGSVPVALRAIETCGAAGCTTAVGQSERVSVCAPRYCHTIGFYKPDDPRNFVGR